ncbi:MAG: UvrD-helicase domain-containing protein [Opitutales bacterium]
MIDRIDWSQPVLRPGVTLIEASAGTGKTFTIEGLVLRLLLDGGFAPSNLLLVTFTKAAVASLRRRLRKRLTDACAELASGNVTDPALAPWGSSNETQRREAARRLRQALQLMDEITVTTIHGFCQRLLTEAALAAGGLSEFEIAPNPSAQRAQRLEDYCARHFHQGRPWLSTVLRSRPEWRKELGRLDDLATFASSIHVLNTQDDLVDLEAAELRIAQAHRALRTGWQADDFAVAALLCEHAALSEDRRKWKGTRGQAVGQLGALLTDSQPRSELLDWAPLFTSAGIDERIKPAERAAWPGTPFTAQVDSFIEAAEAGLESVRHHFYEAAVRSKTTRPLTRPVRSFDDLLIGARQMLDGPNGETVRTQIRGRLQAVLIDEFQDTDPLQWATFELLFAEPPTHLYLVGDPKQAIYSFRGADVFAYLRARAKAERTFRLGTNYRSVPTMIEAVNALFSASAQPFVIPGIGFEPSQPRSDPDEANSAKNSDAPPALTMSLYGLHQSKPMSVSSAETLIVRGLLADLLHLLQAEGGIDLGSIAVLTRSNRLAQTVAAALREQGVPVRLQNGINVLDTEEAHWLFTVLHATVQATDGEGLRAALMQPFFGWSAQRIRELDTTSEAARQLEERRQQWQRDWTRGGLPGLLSSLEQTDACLSRLLERPNGGASLARVQRLGEVIRLAEAELHLSPGGSLRWFGTALQTEAKSDEERYLLTTENEGGGIHVLTAHQSKGLEYAYIFCPFFWRGPRAADEPISAHAPLASQPEQRCLALAPKQRVPEVLIDAATREAASEESRLLYVALTRAKQRCWAYWANVKGVGTSPWNRLAPKDTDFAEWLSALGQAHPNAIQIQLRDSEDDTASWPVFSNEQSSVLAPKARCFKKRIEVVAATSSFSSLVSQTNAHEADYDAQIQPLEIQSEPEPALTFPPGMRTGRLFHEILERIDFSDTNGRATVVLERLRAHGFLPAETWLEPTQRLITATLNLPLPHIGQGFALNQIERAQRREEVEFALPVQWFSGLKLVSQLRSLQLLPDGDADTGPRRTHGVLRGFIDLLFLYQKKYYIVDWKTNLLGSYDSASIARAMSSSAYRLQANLYTLALQRALGATADIGGAYYLFVRGTPDASGSMAAHFEPPDAGLLDSLAGALGLPELS